MADIILYTHGKQFFYMPKGIFFINNAEKTRKFYMPKGIFRAQNGKKCTGPGSCNFRRFVVK